MQNTILSSLNRDPCVKISSVWVHKWVWMLANLTLVYLLFLAISIFIFNIFKYYFYTSVCDVAQYVQRGMLSPIESIQSNTESLQMIV